MWCTFVSVEILLQSLISTCAALHFDTKYKPIFFLINSGCEKEDLNGWTIQFFFQNKINNTYGQSDIYLHTYLCGRVISIIVHLVKILPQWILQCTQDHQCMHSNTIFFFFRFYKLTHFNENLQIWFSRKCNCNYGKTSEMDFAKLKVKLWLFYLGNSKFHRCSKKKNSHQEEENQIKESFQFSLEISYMKSKQCLKVKTLSSRNSIP